MAITSRRRAPPSPADELKGTSQFENLIAAAVRYDLDGDDSYGAMTPDILEEKIQTAKVTEIQAQLAKWKLRKAGKKRELITRLVNFIRKGGLKTLGNDEPEPEQAAPKKQAESPVKEPQPQQQQKQRTPQKIQDDESKKPLFGWLIGPLDKQSAATVRLWSKLAVVVPPFVLACVLGWDALTSVFVRWFSIAVSHASQHVESRDVWIVFAAIGFERFMYTFIWLCPGLYERLCHANPIGRSIGSGCDNLAACFKLSKIVSLAGFSWWFAKYSTVEGLVDFSAIQPAQWLIGVQLILLGQLLNAGLFHAIGFDGVFYGCKFGKNIPWATGFPFNLGVANPQYVGAAMSVVGLQIILATDALVAEGWFFIGFLQVLQYGFMAAVESFL